MIADGPIHPGDALIMERFFCFCAFVCLFSASALAQVATPTATPAMDEEVVKITTALIQIDVTVTDSRGKIIRDLKPEEIEIYENGKKERHLARAVVQGLRVGPFGVEGDGAFALVAFLQGAAGAKFNLLDIISGVAE